MSITIRRHWRPLGRNPSTFLFLGVLALCVYLLGQVIPDALHHFRPNVSFRSRPATTLTTPPSNLPTPWTNATIIGSSRIISHTAYTTFQDRMDCWTRSGVWEYRSDRGVSITPQDQRALFPGYASCDTPLSEGPTPPSPNDHAIAREAVRWHWETSEECPLYIPSREELCTLLGHRTIILIGDPTLSQLTNALLQRMGLLHPTEPSYISAPCEGSPKGCTQYPLCVAPTDETSPGTSAYSPPSLIHIDDPALLLDLPQRAVLGDISSSRVPALVITSTHPTMDVDLAHGLRSLRSLLPGMLHIHRSGYAPHPSCFSSLHPASHSPYSPPPSWARLQERHLALIDVVRASGGLWWDVEGLMLLREDGHVRAQSPAGPPELCLEWCQPGPIEAWESTLYAMLQDLL